MNWILILYRPLIRQILVIRCRDSVCSRQFDLCSVIQTYLLSCTYRTTRSDITHRLHNNINQAPYSINNRRHFSRTTNSKGRTIISSLRIQALVLYKLTINSDNKAPTLFRSFPTIPQLNKGKTSAQPQLNQTVRLLQAATLNRDKIFLLG